VRIMTAHKILIGSAIALFIFFGIWKFKDYANTGEVWTLVSGLLSLLVAIGFGIYFRSLRWKEF